MPVPLGLLQSVGKAAFGLFSGGIPSLAEVGSKIASHVWEWWGKEKREKERRAELEALAQATAAELRAAVREVVAGLAAASPPETRSRLESYLLALPAQIRRTFRRPSDAAGRTVPPDLALNRVDDLVSILPARPPRFAAGDRVAGTDFELVELLGIGGFGEVWKARNAFMPGAPMVALKFCLDETAAASLRRETELLDRIQREGKHPGIVELRHTYLSAEPPFLEYELIEGGDLGGLIVEWHRKKGGPSPDEAARLIKRLAEIVAFAHARGIVHRDLKPANVLVKTGPDGRSALRVADFGIGDITAETAARVARLTGMASTRTAAAACGGYSLYYASPEQVRGTAPADPRDDVHAIGVVWYQLLVGDLTAEAPRGPGWKKRLAAKGMSAGLIDFLESCMATDREDRPASAAAVVGNLELIAEKHAVVELDGAISRPAVPPIPTAPRAAPPVPPSAPEAECDWDMFRLALVTLRAEERKAAHDASFFGGCFLGLSVLAGCVARIHFDLSFWISLIIGTAVITLCIFLAGMYDKLRFGKRVDALRAKFPREFAAFENLNLESLVAINTVIEELERRLTKE